MVNKCYVCRAPKPKFRFPKCEKKLSKWLKSLGISKVPPEYARLCSKHFTSSDFEQRGKKTCVLDTAVPTNVKLSEEIIIHDHTYDCDRNSTGFGYPPQFFLCLTFLLLFFFDLLLCDSLDSSSKKAPKHDIGNFMITHYMYTYIPLCIIVLENT